MYKTQNPLQFQRPVSSMVSLCRRWWMVTLLYSLSLGGGYLGLPVAWRQEGLANQWVLLAGLVMAYLLWHFYRGLPYNHRQGETRLLPTLGLGNSLTLLRGLAIGLLAGFLFLPRPAGGLFAWAPAILYTSIIVLDYLDGYAARVTNHATRLGETLDGVYDAAGFLAAVGLLVGYGLLPVWYLLVGVAPYLFGLGLWWRQRHGRPIFDLPPSRRRRLLAGFQMVFISLLLWPLPYPPAAAALAGLIFALPILAGFWRDWLVVSGRLDAASPRYLALRARLSELLDAWLPPLLRGGVVLLALIYLGSIILGPAGRQLLLSWPEASLSTLAANLLPSLAGIASLMLALGLLARVAALGLLIPTLMAILAFNLNLWNGLLLVGIILLMLLGGGKWSLCRWDDLWVTIKAGAPQ